MLNKKKSDKICERKGEIEERTSMKPSLSLSILTLWVYFFEVHADLCTSLSIEFYLLVLAIWQPKTVCKKKKKPCVRFCTYFLCVPYVQSCDSGALLARANIWLFVLFPFFYGVMMITNQRESLYKTNNIQYYSWLKIK